MTTLIESKAHPFGSRKGVMTSMLVHGLIVAGVVLGTTRAMLPPREKVEEHPVLYVASPAPPPVHVAPDPLPKTAAPPKKQAAPRPRVVQPAPPVPKAAPRPALVAPAKIALNIPAVNIATPPAVEIATAAPTQPPGAGLPSGLDHKVVSDEGGDVASRGGLGSGSSGKAYDENQVDRIVEVRRNSPPRYPDALRSVGVQGSVVVRFIVSADGKVEPGSIEIISSPHKLFGDAVRTALLNTRYRPAEAAGHPVRQLVEQSFAFQLSKNDP